MGINAAFNILADALTHRHRRATMVDLPRQGKEDRER
jgi:hypothetical protein